MFLKSQQDLDNLLKEYPIGNFSIRIKAGKQVGGWISSNPPDEISLAFHKYQISDSSGIILRQLTWDDKKDPFRFEYKYGNEGIEVMELWKKLPHIEDSELERFPLILNGVDFRDKEAGVRDLYVKWMKLGIVLGYAKMMLHVCQNVRLDPETFNDSYEGTYVYHFLGQSIWLQLATIARRIGDTDKFNNLSVKTFSKEIKNFWILPDSETEKEISAIWEDKVFKNEIDKWIFHMDESYVNDRVSVKRSSNSSSEMIIGAMQNDLLRKNVESLFIISEDFFKKLRIPFWFPINWDWKLKLSLTVI